MEEGKKTLVVSHERSGTHFLINSMACNFGYEFAPTPVPIRSMNLQAISGTHYDYQSFVKSYLEERGAGRVPLRSLTQTRIAF
jgi:hypothetical protein